MENTNPDNNSQTLELDKPELDYVMIPVYVPSHNQRYK